MKSNYRKVLLLIGSLIFIPLIAGCLTTEFGGGARIAPINHDSVSHNDVPLYNFDGYTPVVEINVVLNKHKFLVSGMILGILIPFIYVIMKSYISDSLEKNNNSHDGATNEM
jgi:hypothetical protein